MGHQPLGLSHLKNLKGDIYYTTSFSQNGQQNLSVNCNCIQLQTAKSAATQKNNGVGAYSVYVPEPDVAVEI